MRLALAQRRADASAAVNLERAEQDVREAASRGAELVCLQELFATRYFPREEDPEHFALAEPLDGTTTARMRKVAAELEVVIVVPLFERRAPGLYHNSAITIDAGGEIAGVYRKAHVPHDPEFFEKYYFAPGEPGGTRAVDTAAGRIGVLICWDQWFPEAARLLALDGAELLLYPSAIAWQPEEGTDARSAQLEAWVTSMRAHAIANGVWVAAVNRTGREERLEFWGSSFVCDPAGRVVARAPEGEEALLLADCPRNAIEAQRRAWPFLRDRRIDAYGPLLERWRR
jgi:N-carbamoylputrescine amidase